jgi:N-acetylglucosaminyl-diphospho-decaprenol L-rhamnosyltransferase
MTDGAVPSVGVVVVTRNRRERALATLDRLRDLPEQPEVVVVDNNSGDGTARALHGRHPAVRVLELPWNAGASGRNAGVRALSTDLVALNDDDSWWAPGALATAAEVFAGRAALGLLQARILVGDEARLDPVCAAMEKSPLERRPGLPGPALLGFVACAAVVRRTAFLDASGFNPRLGLGGEEKLLALDLAQRGWELAYVAAVTAHHHPDSGDRGSRRARTLRNDLWTTWLRRRLPAAATISARLAATALRERQPGVLLEAVRGMPWVLAERRPLTVPLERAAQRVH